MNTIRLQSFLEAAQALSRALDDFVGKQRAVSSSVRARDWPSLETALRQAQEASQTVARLEESRATAWAALLHETGLPLDASVFRVSLAVPVAHRVALTDAYRDLRLASVRARIENEALGSFVGSSAATLSKVMEELYPQRKNKVYGKSGKAVPQGSGALVLNKAI